MLEGLIGRARLWPWLTIAKIAGGIVAAVIAVLIYRQIFVVPEELRQDAAEARQDTKAAQGTANMSGGTLETMRERGEDRQITRETVRENERNILSAPGANEAMPADVHGAGIDAIRRLREQAAQRQRKAP